MREETEHGEATCSRRNDREHHIHHRNEAEGHSAHGRKGTLSDAVFGFRRVEGCGFGLAGHSRKRRDPCHTRAMLCPCRRPPKHLRGGLGSRQGLDMEGAARRHPWGASGSGSAEAGVDKREQTKRT